MWNPVFEAAAWAGGTHEAGSETVSYDLGWFWSAECEDIQMEMDIFSVVWLVEKRERERWRTGV